MGIKKTTSAHCVINNAGAVGRPHCSDGAPAACRIVDPARKRMALGISAGEMEQLGLDEQTLRTICEYARLDDDGGPASDAVETMLRTLAEETRKVDLEIEMLGLRKRALNNRARLLRKLAGMLETVEHTSTAD